MADHDIEASILEGKLYPATGTARPLPRALLDDCPEVLDGTHPVTLVVAPAGYGKSTLMARWHATLAGRGVSCAWLSLDEDDRDTARFLRHLVAALQAANPRIGAGVVEHLAGDLGGTVKPLLEALAAELARQRQRIVLFLDDLQFVAGAEALEIIGWLVNYAPRVLQQVIGSREDVAGLPLASLRVRHQLFEVDTRRLRFSGDEAAGLLCHRLGRALPARELQVLLDKTEGWPAAIELAAFALAEAADARRFVEQFAGSDSSVVDYLGEIVLGRLDARTRTFVFRIAMADRVNAPLARVLSGDDDAEALLASLRARHLFLIPLDRDGTWVRFHHLVGGFFRERFRRAAPDEARSCLLRCADWLHAEGMVEEAIGAAIRAEDWARATEWLAAAVEELVFRRGYHQTILRWMQALPDAWIDRHPVIRIQYVFALAFHPQLPAYEAQIHRLKLLLDALEARPQADPGMVTELRMAIELQTTVSAALRDEGRLGGELAAAWLARWPEAPLHRRGAVGNVLAFGHKSAGRIDEGLAQCALSRRWLEQVEGHYSLAWTIFIEAVLHLKRGSYLDARRTCADGLDLLERRLHGHPVHASLFHAALAAIAYEFDEIERAVEHVDLAMANVDAYGPADALIVAHLTQARLQRLRRDEESALAILRAGQELGARRGLRRVGVTLAAEECNHLARIGRHEEARIVATRFGFDRLPSQGAAGALSDDKALRAASRYLLKQAPGLVVEALGPMIEDCARRRLARRGVEVLLLRALGRSELGDADGALADMQRALEVAAPCGFVRVFLDELADLRPLVERLSPERLRGSAAGPQASRLQAQLRGLEATGTGTSPDAAAVDQLTKREIVILKRLDSGMSNREIAEAMFISEGTLKWHLHNIYGKLDVKNRSGAMTRARGIGIL
ncbi:MAG: AAA family ATPase [Proteobacteria bacterium]|nr:AAA family ATPase [Pseudomonadota bacterium]